MPVVCPTCHSTQPKNWKSGDHCSTCGHVVRKELRCSWCLHLSPEGKFCKHCGCEIFDDNLFGVGLMLKALGVSQPDLPKQLQQLSKERIGLYQSQFNRQYAIILNEIERVSLFASYLTFPFSEIKVKIEEELLQQLPFEEASLLQLETEYHKRYTANSICTEQQVFFLSTIAKELFTLTCFKQSEFHAFNGQDCARAIYKQVTEGENHEVRSIEYALFFAHPNAFTETFSMQTIVRNTPQFSSDQQIVDKFLDIVMPLTEHSTVAGHANLALFHLFQHFSQNDHPAFQQIQHACKSLLHHKDLTLRLSAALLFNHTLSLVSLAQLPNAEQSKIALFCLLKQENEFDAGDIINNNRLSIHQLEAACLYVQQCNGHLSDTTRQRYNKLASFAINNLLTEADYRSAMETEWHGSTLALQYLNFAIHFGCFTQDQVDNLLGHAMRFKSVELIKCILHAKVDEHNSPDYSVLFDRILHDRKQHISETQAAEIWEETQILVKEGVYPELNDCLYLLSTIFQHLSAIQGNAQRTTHAFSIIKWFTLSGNNNLIIPTFKAIFNMGINPGKELDIWFWYQLHMFNIVPASQSIFQNEETLWRVNNEFIEVFFEGNWSHFLEEYSQFFRRTECDFPFEKINFTSWICRDANDFVNALLTKAPHIAHHLLETMEAKKENEHQALLFIENKEGQNPFLELLGKRDVEFTEKSARLFFQLNRSRKPQYLACEEKAWNYFVRNNGENLHGSLYKSVARSNWNRSVSKQVLWFLYNLSYQTVQEVDEYKWLCDKVDYLTETYPGAELSRCGTEEITLNFLINEVFGECYNLVYYLIQNKKYSFESPLNRLIVHALHKSFEYTCLHFHDYHEEEYGENVEARFCCAITALINPETKSQSLNEQWIPSISSILCSMQKHSQLSFSLFFELQQYISEQHFSLPSKFDTLVSDAFPKFLRQEPNEAFKLLQDNMQQLIDVRATKKHWIYTVLKSYRHYLLRVFESDPNKIYAFLRETMQVLDNTSSELGGSDYFDRKRLIDSLHDFLMYLFNSLRGRLENTPTLEDMNQLFTTGNWAENIKEAWTECYQSNQPEDAVEEELVELENNQDLFEEQPSSAMDDEEEYHENADSETEMMDYNTLVSKMATFKPEKQEIEEMLEYFTFYRHTPQDNPIALSILMMHLPTIKTLLAEDLDLYCVMFAKLMEVLLDRECSPEGQFKTYGSLAVYLFEQCVNASTYGEQYIQTMRMTASMAMLSPTHLKMIVSMLENCVVKENA